VRGKQTNQQNQRLFLRMWSATNDEQDCWR